MTTTIDGLNPLSTPQQLAEYLGTTVGSLANARVLGSGIPFVKFGKLVRYRREDILDYVSRHTITSTDERVSA